MFERAYQRDEETAKDLEDCMGMIASNEMAFIRAMRVLRSYSLIEDVQEAMGYFTHPVVHKWAYWYQDVSCRETMSRLALFVIAAAMPTESDYDRWIIQRQLISHAEAYSRLNTLATWRSNLTGEDDRYRMMLAMLDLGDLFFDQVRLNEAEKIFAQLLQDCEKLLGPKSLWRLDVVMRLAIIWQRQKKLGEAEEMFIRVLKGHEELLGPNHIMTLHAVNNLGDFYRTGNKLEEAEKLLTRAVKEIGELVGLKHLATLASVDNLGLVYLAQGKLDEAEKIFRQILADYKEILSPETFGSFKPISGVLWHLAIVLAERGNTTEGVKLLKDAYAGFESLFGSSCDECKEIQEYLAYLSQPSQH
jgi:tetratricopeptide (TPR) repeat protein